MNRPNLPDPEPLEQWLSAQPRRAPPPAWREEILRAAHEVARARDRSALFPPDRARDCWALLRGWLWPHPNAWGTVAAVWVLVLALNWTGRYETPVAAQESASSPGAAWTAWHERQQALHRLLQDDDIPPANLHPTLPLLRPQSAIGRHQTVA